MKNTKLILITAAIAASIVIGIIAAAPTVEKLIAYNEAMQLLDDKQFDEAKDKFEDLRYFKDSPEMVSEADYRKAMDYFENGFYLFAAEIFEKLDDYSDSQMMANESNYMLALKYLKEKRFSSAIELFEKLEDYKDSAEMYKEAVYLYAKYETENGNSSDALNLYNKIPGYKDVDKYLSQYSNIVVSFEIDNQTTIKIKYDEKGRMINAQSSSNNNSYNFIFDENGIITVPFTLNPGDYTLTCVFGGDDGYFAASFVR